MKRTPACLFAALLTLPALMVLVWPTHRPAAATPEPLTVAAASSLQPVLRELGREFGGALIFVFGASGNLARQMEHGAPYDVLVSAEEVWVRGLARAGVIDPASVKSYARGRLALVLLRRDGMGTGAGEVDAAALAALRGGAVRHIALANPSHAPYGMAAREALQKAKLWQVLEPKLVYGENVRQALTFVETGNAEAGFVAESIARGGDLHWLPVAEELHAPIRQALGIRAGTATRPAAERFVALLSAPPGRRILEKFGLVPLPQASGGRRP